MDLDFERNLTIKDIMNNLTNKFIQTSEVSCMTPQALSHPITPEMLNTFIDEGISY